MEIQAEQALFSWGHSRRFNTYADYFRKTFGERVQKLALNAGFTCPNRDGTISRGGCIFCNNDAFNPSYCHPSKSIAQQIEEGIDFHKNRYRRATKYLAYFQAFSNTYAPLKTLQEIYSQALEQKNVIGLVIATRPDCIDDEKLAYLTQLSKKYYILIEYGVESCNNDTLRLINRGHSFEQAVQAIEQTHRAGIKTGAHFIFGLPHESISQWMQWSRLISELPLHTVKFHQLQIMHNTPIASLFEKNPAAFPIFDFEEYIDFMIAFLERLNPRFVVERFAGEAPPRFLLQPAWGWRRNDQITQYFEQKLAARKTYQGRLFSPQDTPLSGNALK
jgi:radical SAM protein (TIGR01212 family)